MAINSTGLVDMEGWRHSRMTTTGLRLERYTRPTKAYDGGFPAGHIKVMGILYAAITLVLQRLTCWRRWPGVIHCSKLALPLR